MSHGLMENRNSMSHGNAEHYEPEHLQMEQWLDDHPDFAHDYFVRKAKRTMVDGWLVNHALAGAPAGGTPPQPLNTSESSTSGSNSKNSSGANTPVRKISAQEFEKSGHILRPIVSTVDGVPTFLSPAMNSIAETRIPRKSVNELKALDERELMSELVLDICNDLDVTSLCHKILQNVSLLLKANRCSLFLVQGDEAAGTRCLASKLFDVTSQSTLRDCTLDKEEIRVPWGSGIVGHVAKTGTGLNIPDAYEDPRFNNNVDSMTGFKTRSILCYPIRDTDGEVVGVAQAINKLNSLPFDQTDEKVFMSYLAFCGIGIRNAQMFERSTLENRRNQLLLDLARVIFEEQNNVATLIHKIMLHTQSLLRCQRCQVLLVDENSKGVFSQVFDLQASDFDNDDNYTRKGSIEPRFPINIGITGYVATTGETLNIPDAYEDDRFDASSDKRTNFRTRSILCMPIKNAQNQVIGVCQFVNKMDESPFNNNDEHLFEAFAIFCGLGINNTRMYEKAVRAMAKQRVALECLSYHAAAPNDHVQRIKKLPVPSAQFFHLLDVGFDDSLLDDDNTVRAVIRMFMELDLVEKFHINYEMLCRWLLSVKRNYRNVTYHNWRHAFNVAQTMFWMMTEGNLGHLLGDLECLALLVGCLCHDLDHRGTNNQFQIKTMSPLAQLYSTSVMEHHHFDQCVMILSTKGSEILSAISPEDYETVTRVLEHAILATDLAVYFRYRGEFFNLVESGKADWSQDDQRDLLRGMLMTACDIAAISKPWEIQKKTAKLIAAEFFEQGDIERKELKIEPMDMMDRDKKDQFPAMQIGFIDSICLPVYSSLVKINNRVDPILQGCKSNRDVWQKKNECKDERKKKVSSGTESSYKSSEKGDESRL